MNCPAATQDPKLNNRNRLRAVREAKYGPVRITMFGMQVIDLEGGAALRYWRNMARRWGIPYTDAIRRRCGNCAAFDTSPEMVNCRGASRNGTLGYCHAWNFTCAARRSCLSWSPRR